MVSNSELEKAVFAYKDRLDMASTFLKTLLKRKIPYSQADLFKYMTIRWFRDKNCAFGELKIKKTPPDWKECNTFFLDFKGYKLTLLIQENKIAEGILVSLIYTKQSARNRNIKSISRSVFENLSSLPELFISDDSHEPPSEMVDLFNEIFYSFEVEFFHPIIQCLIRGDEPRSTPATPKRKHSQRA